MVYPLANFENFGEMVSSVQSGKIVWCLLSTVAKLSGVFSPQWLKSVVSFVHPSKKYLVSFGSGVFCLDVGQKTPDPKDTRLFLPV